MYSKFDQINAALVNTRLSKPNPKKKVKNKHHMPWQRSEVKVQTAGIQSEKIWTLTDKAHTQILANLNEHSVPFFSWVYFNFFNCWRVYPLPFCLIELIQHYRTSFYMILAFQNDSVHKNINPNKGAAEYFGDFFSV